MKKIAFVMFYGIINSMSLEPNFIPPEQTISVEATKKRNELITWFKEVVDDSIVGMIVSGSMGYGYDYSVKETSDIDMQLIVTPETVNGLRATGLFNEKELEKVLSGYLDGVFGQFSIVFDKDGVNMECHFWDLSAFIKAITYEAAETKRLRSGIETPSTDHGFSFDRKESIKDYFGEMIGNYPVGIFPSYREEELETLITETETVVRLSIRTYIRSKNMNFNDTIERVTSL